MDMAELENSEEDEIIASSKPLPKKTMEQLAREGAAKAFHSDEDEDASTTFKNDTTAMSDLNSLQNFSYYGRRFQDR